VVIIPKRQRAVVASAEMNFANRFGKLGLRS
jgi:hypothetical protein